MNKAKKAGAAARGAGDPKPRNKQEGVSGYMKDKKQTLEELNKAMDTNTPTPKDNAVDETIRQMDREAETQAGVTDRMRNIFGS